MSIAVCSRMDEWSVCMMTMLMPLLPIALIFIFRTDTCLRDELEFLDFMDEGL